MREKWCGKKKASIELKRQQKRSVVEVIGLKVVGSSFTSRGRRGECETTMFKAFSAVLSRLCSIYIYSLIGETGRVFKVQMDELLLARLPRQMYDISKRKSKMKNVPRVSEGYGETIARVR